MASPIRKQLKNRSQKLQKSIKSDPTDKYFVEKATKQIKQLEGMLESGKDTNQSNIPKEATVKLKYFNPKSNKEVETTVNARQALSEVENEMTAMEKIIKCME